jgi:MFS transporter, DHA3 family, macrolide efflux protein
VRLTGMKGFVAVWAGQVCSLLGSGMTAFALAYWVYQQTGLATSLALLGLAYTAPTVLLSPLAGALVDRWSRKQVLILSDAGAGLATLALLLLYLTGRLESWHLYAAVAAAGAFQSFQFPAFSAAIATMLNKEQYGRANGMMSLAEAASGILAPIMAAALIGTLGLAAIMLIDLVTFLAAVGALLLVEIPPPKETAAGREGRGSLLQESLYGFRYILARPSLFGVQMVFFTINLLGSLVFPIQGALVLARTGGSAPVLGSVMSAGAIGGVAGGLLMSVWGGPRRRIHGVLIGMALNGALGTLLFGLGQSLSVWAFSAFCGGVTIAVLNGSNQALWQAKVAPDVQGRVFAVRRLIAQVTSPVAMLAAGPLADRLFEPAMMPGGALTPLFGDLIGTGPGTGIGVMFLLAGVLTVAAALSGYAVRFIRDVDALLPDHGEEPVTRGA